MSIKKTLKERRAELTEKVRQARQDFHNVQLKVKYEVRKEHPGLKETNWVEFYKLVDDDIRCKLAAERLMALCEAANIMGAELD